MYGTFRKVTVQKDKSRKPNIRSVVDKTTVLKTLHLTMGIILRPCEDYLLPWQLHIYG